MVVFVTGGAGFIGSNFLNYFVQHYPMQNFINIDNLTYAANLHNLDQVANLSNYRFEKGCITDYEFVEQLFKKYEPDLIVHFAAESHVDRSIIGPSDFIQTNIIGTFNLLEACRKHWKNSKEKLFHHVSTDEVYGSLGINGYFTEDSKYAPNSPYSASKAASDHLVQAYNRTYNIPVKITNSSNNYGPYQFPEKLIPLMIINCLEGKKLPVYGAGLNVRDWIYVEDHIRAIWTVIEKGAIGATYNIGGNNEWKNIDVVKKVCELMAEETGREYSDYERLIFHVEDRPGHDFRYALDSSKIRQELGWKPHETFLSGLRKTIRWYLSNIDWINGVKTGTYRKWIDQMYGNMEP